MVPYPTLMTQSSPIARPSLRGLFNAPHRVICDGIAWRHTQRLSTLSGGLSAAAMVAGGGML